MKIIEEEYIKAMRRELLRWPPSIYIFKINFFPVFINRKNIHNRPYVVNIEAIGLVVMAEWANTLALTGSRKSLHCVMNRQMLRLEYCHLCITTNRKHSGAQNTLITWVV